MAMDFMSQYKKKLVTADEAVKVIKSGDWVEHAFGI
jgi:acyl-CoA hydrolase